MNIDDDNIPLSEIVARFPGHLFWKNRQGIYLGCNREQALSVGLTCPEDLIGKTDFDIVVELEAQRLRQRDLQVMESGETYISEETVVLKNEEKIFISKKAPLRNLEGDVVGVIGTSVDITQQKITEASLRDAMQKAEVASQAKNEFIANMSHDLRTPLSGIQALAETIRLESKDPKLIYNMDLLLNASGDLLKLIDSIMDVVRVDANAVADKQSTEFRLSPLITNSVNIIMPKVHEKQIDFKLYYDDQIPETLVGQSLMLQRIIINLLSNALKFTERGGQIEFNITVSSVQGQQYILSFEVKDTGIGIPEDKIDVIFDKFSRISESFKGKYRGTGVGLYMVKQYIDRMGGLISVKSREKQGTTFICQLPFEMGQATVEVARKQCQLSKTVLDKQANFNKLHILLVEDNIIAQYSQATKFKLLGCQVIIAATAQQATHFFKKDKFDLLVIDLGLPDLDGWSLARRFRVDRSNPNSLVPIVILTAHVNPKDVIADTKGIANVVFRRKPLLLDTAEQLLRDYTI